MSDAVQIQLIITIGFIVTQWLSYRRSKRVETKVDHNVELSNSMLSHQVARKEEAEHKLEQTKQDELLVTKTKLAEAEKQIALLTNAPAAPKSDDPKGGNP